MTASQQSSLKDYSFGITCVYQTRLIINESDINTQGLVRTIGDAVGDVLSAQVDAAPYVNLIDEQESIQSTTQAIALLLERELETNGAKPVTASHDLIYDDVGNFDLKVNGSFESNDSFELCIIACSPVKNDATN